MTEREMSGCEGSTCQRPSEHDSMTCYARYVELEHEGVQGGSVMTRDEWTRAMEPITGADDTMVVEEDWHETEEEAVSPLTSVEFMEYLCEDSGMCGGQIADLCDATDRGWMVEAGTAFIETGDGRTFLVRVSEVTGR